MNTATDAFRLIIINDEAAEARRLASMFQNAGKPCRASHIDSAQALNAVIGERAWDLLIVDGQCQKFLPKDVLQAVRRSSHDLPVILLADPESSRSVIDGMKLGARDVVMMDDDQHLLLVVERELQGKEQRKRTRMAERKLREVERRNHELLDSSKDGIAYVQDGLFVYANDSFANVMGYDDRDAIESLPLMDAVADSDQPAVKKILRTFPLSRDPLQRRALSLHSATEPGRAVDMELRMDTFEDEPCIQFVCRAKQTEGEDPGTDVQELKYVDGVTGLHTRPYLVEHLQQLIGEVNKSGGARAFIYLGIDNFDTQVESVVKLEGADLLLKEVALSIKQHSRESDLVARFGSSDFAIISEENNIERLLTSFNSLTASLADRLFEINNKTVRITVSAGVTLINETSIDTDSVVSEGQQAVETLRKNSEHAAGVGNAAAFFQPGDTSHTMLFNLIQEALAHNRFALLFQPVINLRGDSSERYEVMVQLDGQSSAEKISTQMLFDAANQMQVTGKIDRWAVLESLKYLSGHNKSGHNAQLVINISHFTLCDEAFVPWLKVALKATRIKPGSLVFQAREAEIHQYLTKAKKFLSDLQEVGIDFSISHFGCAIDPESVFTHLDVSYVQIDGSFTIECQENPENCSSMEKLLTDLHQREKITTVPLVENAMIISSLWKMGACFVQGHYLQPPSGEMDYEFSMEN